MFRSATPDPTFMHWIGLSTWVHDTLRGQGREGEAGLMKTKGRLHPVSVARSAKAILR